MENLTAASGHSCGLNILSGDYVERIHGVTAPEAVGYATHEGVRAPLYASPSGKLCPFMNGRVPGACDTDR